MAVVQWAGIGKRVWDIVKPYHTGDLGTGKPTIRVTLKLVEGKSGEILIMKGSEDDCFTEYSVLDASKARELYDELHPILNLPKFVYELKVRADYNMVPMVEAKFYLVNDEGVTQ